MRAREVMRHRLFAGLGGGAVLLAALFWLAHPAAQAGGPNTIAGTLLGGIVDSQIFTFDTSLGEVQYRTDGGSLGQDDNAAADARVAGMFQVWEDVPTATIGFNRVDSLLSVGAFTDGDVNTMDEFNAVEGDCNAGNQSPIIYDADGSLFADLGKPASVIGFAGTCQLALVSSVPRIITAQAVLNGDFHDGDFGDGSELTSNEFDAVFIHEFGHFFGLDHSQINLNCLTGPGCASFSSDSFGLPTMFPVLISGLEESPGVHPARTLSQDDTAWVSRLYPGPTFNSNFGTISGTIFFSDGVTPAQGVNVIAREVGNPRQDASSVVSGYLFTGNFGQSVTGTNPGDSGFGSHNTAFIGTFDIPVPPGSYTVEIEAVNPSFVEGSTVGPVGQQFPFGASFQFPLPGPPEFFNSGESSVDNPGDSTPVVVTAGSTASGINIIMNGTPLGLDALEPNDSVAAAAPIFNGPTTGLSVSPFGSDDFYSFTADVGAPVTVEITAQRFVVPSPLDSVIEILDTSGMRLNTCRPLGDLGPFNQACVNDDLTLTVVLDSGIEFQPASTGTFIVHVLDFRGDGRPDLQYDLTLTGSTSVSNNPVPSLSSIATTTLPVGSAGFTLTVNGSDFISSSMVRWNGTDRTTTFTSGTQLEATIPSSDLIDAGTAQVTVFNPAPGGGISNSRTFTITSPTVSSISPTTTVVGSPGFTLTVNGTNFHSGSVVRFNGVSRATTFVSSTQLTAAILVADVVDSGTATVDVLNSAGTGGVSNSRTFTIASPSISSILPDIIPAGSPNFTLTVNGANFISTSVVRFNGGSRATTFVSSTQLTADILAADVATVGTATVDVFNSAGTGGTSNSVTFTINLRNPLPTVTSLSPPGAVAGGAAFTLTVRGNNFVFNASVRWNGVALDPATVTFASKTRLEALIPDGNILTAGTATVDVVNPGPGGGTSNGVMFQIPNAANGAPSISTLSPNSTTAGLRANLVLTVDGSGFAPNAVVRWNGADRPTTFNSSTELVATIFASDLTLGGTAPVTVFNPAPGGGTSTASTFTINNPAPVLTSVSPSSVPAGSPDFIATVTGSGFVPGSVIQADDGTGGGLVDLPTLFVSSTTLRTPVSAADVATAGSVEIRVFNPAPPGIGLLSGPSFFTIDPAPNPAPTITALVPTSAPAGRNGFLLTVNGTNFVHNSVVRWNGSDRPTTFISATQLVAVISAGDVASVGSVNVTVFNPAPGGGESAPPTVFNVN